MQTLVLAVLAIEKFLNFMVFSHYNSGWLLCRLFCRSDRIWTPLVLWFVLTSCLLITILQMSHYWRALAIFLSFNCSLPLTSHGRKQLSPSPPDRCGAIHYCRRWGFRLSVMHSCLQLRKLFQNLDRRGPTAPNTVTWGQKVSDSTTHFKWQLMFLACLITALLSWRPFVYVKEYINTTASSLHSARWDKWIMQDKPKLYEYCRINVDKCFFCPSPTVDQTTPGKHFLSFKQKI